MATAAPLVSVRFKLEPLQRVLLDQAAAQHTEMDLVQAGIEILTPLARKEAPTKTGKAASEILGYVRTQGVHPVGHIHPTKKAFYLAILATGAKPHEIYPFRYAGKDPFAGRVLGPGYRPRGAKRALRFAMGGQIFFRRNVRHRGLRPNPFLDRAALAGDMPLAQAADRIITARYARGG